MSEDPRLSEDANGAAPVYPRPSGTPVRAPWAWAVLGVLFVLLIGMRFVPSDTKDAPSFDEGEVESSLRLALIAKEAASGLSPSAGKASMASPQRELKDVREKLRAHKATDPQAAKYELAVDKELGKPPDAGSLSLLSSSKEPGDRLFARIYDKEPIDASTLQKIEGSLPAGFLGQVARAHARSKSSGTTVKAVGQSEVVTAAAGVALIGLVFLGGFGVLALSPLLFKVFQANGVLEPMDRPAPSEGDRYAVRMSVFIVCFAVVMIAVPALFQGRLLQGVATVLAYVVLIAVMAFMSAQPVFGTADPLPKVLGRTVRSPMLALVGGLAFLANIPLVFLTAVVGLALFPNLPKPHHPVSEMVGKDLNPVTVACLFVMVGFMAPIVEEVSFRGYLFRGLLPFVRPAGAMAASGLLFASIHPQGVLMWVPLGIVGAMGALLTYWTQSLVPAMVMHGLHNTFLMVVAFSLLGT